MPLSSYKLCAFKYMHACTRPERSSGRRSDNSWPLAKVSGSILSPWDSTTIARDHLAYRRRRPVSKVLLSEGDFHVHVVSSLGLWSRFSGVVNILSGQASTVFTFALYRSMVRVCLPCVSNAVAGWLHGVCVSAC